MGGIVVKVLDLFGVFFLLMIVIQGSVVGFYDANNFKKINDKRNLKLARFFGGGSIILAVILFVVKSILT